MTKNYELQINLNDTNGNNAFSESYKIALWDDFVRNSNPKAQ